MTNKPSKRWIILMAIVAIILVSLGLYVGASAHAASKVYASDMRITELREISGEGIVFKGEIELTNPSSLTVALKEIKYTISLDKTKEKIAQGTVEGDSISPRHKIALPFEQETAWLPSMNTLIGLATEKEVYLTVSGKATVTVLGIPLSGNFKEQMDIKQLVDGFIMQKQQEVMKEPERFLKQYQEKYKQATQS